MARRSQAPAHANRVPAARDVPAPPATGAHPFGDLRARVGIRLRRNVELARRIHGLSPAQDGGRRGDAAAAHGARRGIRAAGPMTFRRRITVVSAAAVAIAVVLASVIIYLLTSHQLHSQVDAQLRARGRDAHALLARLNHPGAQTTAATGRAPFGLALGVPARSAPG